MSLSLIQSYSSEEEEDENGLSENEDASFSHSDDGDGGRLRRRKRAVEEGRSVFDHPIRRFADSLLPSAFDAFSEVSGPPEFLNNSVCGGEREANVGEGERGRKWKGRGVKPGKDKKDLPAGAVLEAKAQLVGVHDRVRSDIEGSQTPSSVSTTTTSKETPRLISASNPDAKDAADLLRMCLPCGVPKTYSHTRGMVCPICGDRPPLPDANGALEKKKGSTIKDKEKSKRMKGQSSHSAWKSETEMQLRQQFD